MSNHLKCLKNVILYKGRFYHNKSEKIYLNNIGLEYIVNDINSINDKELIEIIEYDKIVIFQGQFDFNMGHLLWDNIYPSWYGLFFHNEEYWNKDFQWVTSQKMRTSWHVDILHKFSGNEAISLNNLSKKYNKPLKIKLLISSTKDLGIACLKRNLCVKTSLKNHSLHPVETFINRMYLRYKINRNTYDNYNDITNIIYIDNKREQNGIKELLSTLNNMYKNKYNFRYIDWSKYNFEEQLKILNTTRIIICGVGTARTNTPFLPNGSVEIQTNTHARGAHDNINFFDTHIGTLSNFVKIIHINSYTIEECNHRTISKDLMYNIENALKITPYKEPINIEDNLPLYINNIKWRISEENFKKWRKAPREKTSVGWIYKFIDI